MTWLEGSPILEVAENAPLELRNELALRMFRLWYVPFYYYGVIHGDPHLGNYTVAPETTASAPSICSISAASGFSRRASSRA